MTYIKRLGYYSREQLHPGSRLFLSFVIALFVQLLLSLTFKQTPPYRLIIVPTLAPFFLLLYYRISDEFKDYETDKKYFPDRPIPSGRVRLNDLRSLLVILSILGIVLNLLMPYALKEFMAAWVFTFLMGKWFFMEKWIAKNRLLAFITHAPVGYFLYWYVVKFYEQYLNTPLPLSSIAPLLGFFVLPGLTWEILRKTYLPEDEMEGYQTYSAMLGFKGSLSFGMVLIIITAANNFLLFQAFPLLYPLSIPLLIFNLLMLVAVLVQMLSPWIPSLRSATEVYMGLHMMVPLAYLLWLSHV